MHSVDTLDVAKQEGRAPWTDVQLETRDFIVFNDGFPVTPGHALVVPRESTMEKLLRCFNYAVQMGNANVEADTNAVTGFNVGMNVGTSAGQTVMYPHVHLILRRDKDCVDPVGGVRNVIPGAGNYR